MIIQFVLQTGVIVRGSVIIQFVLQTGVIVRGECDYTVCTTDRSHSEGGGVIVQCGQES